MLFLQSELAMKMTFARLLMAGALTSMASCGGSPVEPGEVPTARAVFYGSETPRIALPATVLVDRVRIGTIDGFRDSEPPNCAADFTVSTAIPKDGKNHRWDIRAANGTTNAGVVRAMREGPDCVVVKVF